MGYGHGSSLIKEAGWKLLKIALGCAIIGPLVYGSALVINFFDIWSVSEIIRINGTQVRNATFALCGIYTLFVVIGKI